ncbi:hypothetical protein PS395_07205 [Limosilactobacillus pontis]|uniref:hypothetical protein n=1 Tax=Limosilactobacillus pontis TaxID=35787 RepID=UPI002F2605BA
MADLTKIFTGMDKGPEAIQNNFEMLGNSSKDFADKLDLCDWVKCPLINGATAGQTGLYVRWSKELVELSGDVIVPDKGNESDVAQIPADLNGILSGPYTGDWEDVWVTTGQGATLYQVSLKTGYNENMLHYYCQFQNSVTTSSKLVHIERVWLKHMQ